MVNYFRQQRNFFSLFVAKVTRMFSLGMLVVILFASLYNKGFYLQEISYIQSAIVLGEVVFLQLLQRKAAELGRVKTLMIAVLFKVFAGMWYCWFTNMFLLIVSGTIGVFSVFGDMFCPFGQIQQSIFTDLVEDCNDDRTFIDKQIVKALTYYNALGFISQGMGAGFAGYYINKIEIKFGQGFVELPVDNLMKILVAIQVLTFISYLLLTNIREKNVQRMELSLFDGLMRKNAKTLLLLGFLSSLAGAFVNQAFLSYYYQFKYGLSYNSIGMVFFFCNIGNALNALFSFQLFNGYGAIKVILYCRLPAHICLLLISYATNSTISLGLLFFSFCSSQADLLERQACNHLIQSEEKTVVKRVLFISRAIGLCLGLWINHFFMEHTINSDQFSMPFLIAGVLRIIFDIFIGILLFHPRRNEMFEQIGREQVTRVKTDEQTE